MEYIKKAINYSSGLINRNIYLYLYNLIKYIFLNSKKSLEIRRKLEEHTEKINEEIIKDINKYIKLNLNMYSKENFMNILDFIKMQNLLYAGDIIEGILIMIFSCAFETDRDNSFGKYLFNNLGKIMDPKNDDLITWFTKKDKFRNIDDFKKIKDLITYEEQKTKTKEISIKNKSVFYNLLLEIYKMKYSSFSYNKNNSKTSCFIHRGNFDIQERMNRIYNQITQQKNNSDYILDKDILNNSMSKIVTFVSNEKMEEEKNEIILTPVRLIKGFFTSVYIYYQNKNSILMEFIEPYKINKNNENENNKDNNMNISNKGNKNNKNIKDNEDNKDKDNNNYDDDFIYKDPIPFEYDLKGAAIEGRYSNIILSPLRLESRASRIVISENILRDCGFYEISKTLLFNHNITFIDLNKCMLKSIFMDYFNFVLGVFDNYSIEELNMSYNYMREDCEEYLARMLSHLNGLKTLNLSSNDLKGGLSFFFILLKRLYREGKTNLENLYLNKCILDDASFYELGELLKSKYCKLKILSLSQNNNPSNINFLKKIKKNKTLLEFNLSRNIIGNRDIEDINRIISNTVINHLYLFKNKIADCNDFIKLLYRTKLINDKKESESNNDNVLIDDDSILKNLDLSNNDLWLKNESQAVLINKIIKETNLSCLDISHILFGSNPDKKVSTQSNQSYRNYIDNEIKEPLEESLKNYIANFKNKLALEYELKQKNYELINTFEKELEEYKEFKEEINKIIEQKEAQFTPFLKEKAAEIVKKIIEEQKNKEFENIVQKNKLSNEKDKNEFINNLFDYMKFKEIQKRFLDFLKKVKQRKLIII